MRKIFTLLAVAMMAVCAQAQEKFLFSPTETYTDGQVIEASANVTVTVGPDGKLSKKNFTAGETNAEFAQTYTNADGEQTTQIVYLTGGNNPKDGALDGTASTGSGYKPESKNNPQSGMFFVLSTKKAGAMTAGIILNSGKSFYVTKSDGTALPTSELEFVTPEGETIQLDENNQSADKFYGLVKFQAEAGESYYIFCTGSKISFYGYIFTPEGGGEELPPSNVTTDPALPVVFDTWEANFLIPKTDVRAGDKFVFTCEAIDVAGWEWGAQVLPKSNADWSDLGGAIAPNAEGLATFTVTEEYATAINGNGGLRVQGMGVKVLAVNYEEGEAPKPETPDGDTESIIDRFNYTWKGEETIENNADGTLTYNSISWGGLAAWLASEETGGADWSGYKKLVFEYAEPTTCNTQGFVQTATPEDITYWGDAGITKLECSLEGKNVSAVNQVALQTSDPVKLVIKAIYLVKYADEAGIEERVALQLDSNAPVYNLAGVRVNKDYKGIVIQSGRKFIQK